jgi:FKBP-type peptidyl-prolyl cis-trans isomerase FklB
VTTTESGLQYEVLEQGEGPTAESGQIAVLHYRGTLPDGSVFDSSYDDDPATEDEPASFGVDNVIAGFSEALRLMSVGSRWRVAIPSELAYGAAGAPPNIGPNQVLIFEIELLGLQ